MLSLRNFWRRHRRKAFVTVGLLGSGYVLYKLYDAHRRRLADLERELADEQEGEKFIKAQMQAHFENIQRIADTATLPHAINYLSSRIAEDLDLSQLLERLQKAKGQPNSLTPLEKIELWDRLKIISFTRMVLSLWAMTMLSLYIRVQVNILGRHLYIDTARGLGSSYSLENPDMIDRDDEQKFLATSDFLSNYGLPALMLDMQEAAIEILKGKQLTDFFNTAVLHETLRKILDRLMSIGSPHHWINYIMPEDARFNKLATASSSDNEILSDVTKFDQLMMETHAVLASAEFRSVVEISLKAVLDALMDDMGARSGGSLTSGMPLAKLLSLLTQMGPILLYEPSTNRFIQTIQSVPEVELFFTLLYANMPTS